MLKYYVFRPMDGTGIVFYGSTSDPKIQAVVVSEVVKWLRQVARSLGELTEHPGEGIEIVVEESTSASLISGLDPDDSRARFDPATSLEDILNPWGLDEASAI
jgi:hypothetical protein